MPKQRLLREHHTETIGRRFFIMLSLVAALGIGILALVLDRVILPSQIDLAEQRVRTLAVFVKEDVAFPRTLGALLFCRDIG